RTRGCRSRHAPRRALRRGGTASRSAGSRMRHRIAPRYRTEMTLVAAGPEPAGLVAMQSAVLDWYAANARDLAFRRTTDPWSVLVSEVIAQQTQAARAAAAWTRFIDEFPTPAALAAASPATIIRAWRGLGYNRRAIALRAAAIAIVNDHGGQVPATYDELVRLPG